MEYKEHTHCRVCKSDKLLPYLDLGQMPLSNNLAATEFDPVHYERYPLKVLFCQQCGLSQLSIVVPAQKLFGHYVYRSGIAKGYADHCHAMAKTLRAKYRLGPDTFHVDIAGNDGTLLSEFRKVLGHQVLNVDPAENLRGICEVADIEVFTEFWGLVAARRILNRNWVKDPRVDLITATNVFAHVDDVREFMEAVKLVLKPTGVLVLEFPYLIDFIEKNEFDTVYFEHLSYFSIYPLTLLCREVGLTVLNVTHHDIHGGTVRVIVGYGAEDETVAKFVAQERTHYSQPLKYYQFAEDVHLSIVGFATQIRELAAKHKVAGFAASAKGNTLLNASHVGTGILQYIVDETPEKIGKWSPGTHLPIVSPAALVEAPPDYLVILSWNFASEIAVKCRRLGYQGKFIVPIPHFEVNWPF